MPLKTHNSRSSKREATVYNDRGVTFVVTESVCLRTCRDVYKFHAVICVIQPVDPLFGTTGIILANFQFEIPTISSPIEYLIKINNDQINMLLNMNETIFSAKII